MFEPSTRTIGTTEYVVTPLGAIQGRKALTRLIKLAGPALEKGSIGDLTANLTEADVDYFCDIFAAQTRITTGLDKSGLPIQPLLSDNGLFNVHFAGNYGAMVQWLKFCLETNFSSFFGELGGVLGGVSKIPPKSV